MVDVFVMPQIGRLAHNPTLVEWFSAVGDRIEVGDMICEVETDKATVECESPFAGTILQQVPSGGVIPMGEPIALIGEPGADISGYRLYDPDASDSESPSEPLTVTQGAARTSGDEMVAAVERLGVSPIARRLAKERGVDLETIEGTGPNGRITRSDVENASTAIEHAETDRILATPMEQAIATSMTESATIPQFSIEREINVGALIEVLGGMQENPSVEDAIIVALGRSLLSHPKFLRSWNDGGYISAQGVNVGVATATDGGLVVPVLTSVDRKSVSEVALLRRDLQGRASEGRLQADVSGRAVCTVSNLGVFGITRFRPIVNPPESAILGIGGLVEQNSAKSLSVTLTCDHRVVNGADAALLLSDIAKLLEDATLLEHLSSPGQDDATGSVSQ